MLPHHTYTPWDPHSPKLQFQIGLHIKLHITSCYIQHTHTHTHIILLFMNKLPLNFVPFLDKKSSKQFTKFQPTKIRFLEVVD